jgi:transposase
MQKALDLMNIKIHDVLSETVGVSCLRMIRAIVGGQRDATQLVELCDPEVVRKKTVLLRRALNGTWDEEHLFGLKQGLEGWDFYQQQIAACDGEIKLVLKSLAGQRPEVPPEQTPTIKKRRHNAPQLPDLENMLHRLTGTDLSVLPCVSAYSQLLVLAEIGTDMSPWPTDKHFTAWLGLAPANRHSGKRRRNQKRFRGAAGKIFCVIARSLGRSKYLALAGFYRRLRATRGAQIANIACARKIATLFYKALKHGLRYVEHGLEMYEKKYREQSINRLKKAATVFGLKVLET